MTTYALIPAPIAHRLYDVLVKHAGATDIESSRRQFVQAVSTGDGCGEFRFQGSLGFGGKLRNYGGPWYVDCYREDLTPERTAAIEATNAALMELWKAEGREADRA